MIEKTKILTQEMWKYDPEVDGARKGKIGLHEFMTILQSQSNIVIIIIIINFLSFISSRF